MEDQAAFLEDTDCVTTIKSTDGVYPIRQP